MGGQITKLEANGLTAADITEAFIKGIDASPKTKETYRRAARQYMTWLDAQGIHPFEARRDSVIAYKEHLAASKSAATVNAYITAVRAFYAWAESARLCPNVAAGVKGARMNQRSPKTSLTPRQAHAILDTKPENGNLKALRDYAIFNLMLRRGLRTCEIVRANIEDLQQINGEAVLYIQGKGYAEKGDFVILNESCLAPIYAYLEARGDSNGTAPLFAGIGNRNAGGRITTRAVSGIVKRMLREHGIESAKLTAHSLRHTAVTFALLGGATLQETQAMARHSNINTTLVYAHNLERMAGGAEHRLDAYLDA